MSRPVQLIRKQLSAQLVTPDDFDAFCLGYFPDVSSRFSSGMNRLQRENLLLEMIDWREIEAALTAERTASRKAVIGGQKPVGWSIAFLLAVLIGAVGISVYFRRQHGKTTESKPPAPQFVRKPGQLPSIIQVSPSTRERVINTGDVTTGNQSPVKIGGQNGIDVVNHGSVTTGDHSPVTIGGQP